MPLAEAGRREAAHSLDDVEGLVSFALRDDLLLVRVLDLLERVDEELLVLEEQLHTGGRKGARWDGGRGGAGCERVSGRFDFGGGREPQAS